MNGLKMQKNTKKNILNNKLKTLRKHKLVKPLKSVAIIWLLGGLISFVNYKNWAIIILNEQISSIWPHLKIIGICYYAIVLQKEKKKQKSTTNIIFCENAYCPTDKNQLRHSVSKHVRFWNTKNFMDLSLMRTSYKLTKTTKTEKKRKIL